MPDDFAPLSSTSPSSGQPPPQVQPQNKLDKAIDFIRPYVAGAAGGLAAAGTTAIPGIGETGIAQIGAETQGYAGVDTLLKYLKTNKPASIGESLGESEKDAVINAVTGKIIGGVWAGVKGLTANNMPALYKLTPTVSQALEYYGNKALATGARFLENFGAPAAKSAALDRTAGGAFTQSLAVANTMNKRLADVNIDPIRLTDQLKDEIGKAMTSKINPLTGARQFFLNDEAENLLNTSGKETFKVLDDVIANPDRLAKVINVGQVAGSPNMNVKRDLQAYQFMKMVQDATTQDAKGNFRIEPEKIAKVWNDEKMNTSFKTLYGTELQGRIDDFFKGIAYTQDRGSAETAGKLLRYAGRGNFILGMGLLAHSLSMGDMRGTIPAGIMISGNTMGRLLSNKDLGQAVVRMAEGARLNQSAGIVSRGIVQALKGSTVHAVNFDGSSTDGSIEHDPRMDDFKLVPFR